MSAQELDRCEIDQLSIDDKIKAAVKSAGFSTILNLLAASENEIFWKTGLPSDDITLLIDAVTEASSPKGISVKFSAL